MLKFVAALPSLDIAAANAHRHDIRRVDARQIIELARGQQRVVAIDIETGQTRPCCRGASGLVAHGGGRTHVLRFAVELDSWRELIGGKCTSGVTGIGTLQILIGRRIVEIRGRAQRPKRMTIGRIDRERCAFIGEAQVGHELPAGSRGVQQTLVRIPGLNQSTNTGITARSGDGLCVSIPRIGRYVPVAVEQLSAEDCGYIDRRAIKDVSGRRNNAARALNGLQIAAAIADLIESTVHIHFETSELGVKDKVDHASHRVRAVDGGRPTRKHFHPLDERARDGIQVCGRVNGVTRCGAAAIHQHQGAKRADAA